MKKLTLSNDHVKSIKSTIDDFLQEWVGFDMPEEGDPDFDLLEDMRAEIEACVTLQDFVDFFCSRPGGWEGYISTIDINGQVSEELLNDFQKSESDILRDRIRAILELAYNLELD